MRQGMCMPRSQALPLANKELGLTGKRGHIFPIVSWQIGVPVAATAVALLIGLAIIASTGTPLEDAIAAFWDGMAGSAFNVGASINRAVSLTLVGLGFIFANRANLTNVG